MFERSAAGARRAALASLIALASCATAQQGALPDEATPSAGAGGTSGSSATAGSSAAGKQNGAAGASRGGANSGGANNGGANNGASGAAGSSSSAGSHTGGSAGQGAGGSAGSHAGSSSGGSAGAPGGAGSVGTAGAAGAGASLFSDDFEDGNADGWVVAGGTWAIASDGTKVYAQQATGTGSTMMLSAAGSTAWTNQIVEARIKIKAFGGQSTSYFAAIYGRYNGTDYYALVLRSDGKVAIRHGNSTLGSAVTAGIVEGTWYTVRLELVGSTLKAYVDGVLKDTETDTSLTAGGIALSAVNTTAEFDDVKVSLP